MLIKHYFLGKKAFTEIIDFLEKKDKTITSAYYSELLNIFDEELKKNSLIWRKNISISPGKCIATAKIHNLDPNQHILQI